jgi:hypothetical protein
MYHPHNICACPHRPWYSSELLRFSNDVHGGPRHRDRVAAALANIVIEGDVAPRVQGSRQDRQSRSGARVLRPSATMRPFCAFQAIVITDSR